MNKTVALVGKAMNTRVFAPYDDESIDIWSYTETAFKRARRLDALFEMHIGAVGNQARRSDEYSAWLREPHAFTVWMLECDPTLPASVRYPREDIAARFLRHVWRGDERVNEFFTSSTPYALALALHLGYKRVELYGIELSATPEYTAERDCVFFWMGVANALGVDVVAHPLSNLFRAKVYGYEYPYRQ
jgi:hypothetical protein